jgi:uncharacterized PurR-regulated membrane protein YhhQ (DUF165 family)
MNTDTRRTVEGAIFLAGFAACIPAANWLIGNVGTVCVPDGPCLIPVAPGITAPSGVLMIGMALVLRDLVQRRIGKIWALVAIFFGVFLSALVSPPALVVASTTAFLLAELADFAVYTPLQRRRFVLAVVASGIVGAIVDSAVFLWLAFGSLAFIEGQIVGKIWMVTMAAPLMFYLRLRDERDGLVNAT